MNEKKSSLYKVIKSLKRSKSSIGDPSASIFKDKKKSGSGGTTRPRYWYAKAMQGRLVSWLYGVYRPT